MILKNLDYAKEACVSASKILLQNFEDKNSLKTWFKEKGALVTEADIKSDNKIRDILLKNSAIEMISEPVCIELQLNCKVFWNYFLVWYSK